MAETLPGKREAAWLTEQSHKSGTTPLS